MRIEEYKRPTFEVAFQEPKEPMRLNRKAVLTGEAKYYFGLPVAAGDVTWRVTRETVRPWWWSFWGWGSPSKAQTVASGSTVLGADGTFLVSFTPEAEETAAKGSDLTWRYVVSADVVDEGGETRSATRSVRLGFVSVEARVGFATGFRARRSPLPRRSRGRASTALPRRQGSWRLVTLVPPATTCSRPTCPAAARRPMARKALPKEPRTRRPETPYVPAGRLPSTWRGPAGFP